MGIISAKGTPDMVIDAFIVANHPGKIKPRELLNVVTGALTQLGKSGGTIMHRLWINLGTT